MGGGALGDVEAAESRVAGSLEQEEGPLAFLLEGKRPEGEELPEEALAISPAQRSSAQLRRISFLSALRAQAPSTPSAERRAAHLKGEPSAFF